MFLAIAGVIVAAAIAALTIRFARSSGAGSLLIVDIIAAAAVFMFTPGADQMPLAASGLIVLAGLAAVTAAAGLPRARAT